MEPILLKGGGTVKSLSVPPFWPTLRKTGGCTARRYFPCCERYPQAYFQGVVSLARIIKWEVGPAGAFERPCTPEEIMARLEERVGAEGRRLFEQFIEKVNRLRLRQERQRRQEQQYTESPAATRSKRRWPSLESVARLALPHTSATTHDLFVTDIELIGRGTWRVSRCGKSTIIPGERKVRAARKFRRNVMEVTF
jgi:hypothetical protein